MRLLVQDPTNATSIGVPAIGAPGVSFMWSSASSMERRSSPSTSSGDGMSSSTPRT